VSVLPLSYVRGCYLRPTNQTLKAANGTNIPVLGEAVKFVPPKLKSTVTAVVSEHIMEPMLGLDWLCENKAEWSFGEASIVLSGKRHELVVRPRGKKCCRRVVLREDVEVPPRSQVDLPCKVVIGRREWNSCFDPAACSEVCWGTRPTPLKYGVYVAVTITPDDRFDDIPIVW